MLGLVVLLLLLSQVGYQIHSAKYPAKTPLPSLHQWYQSGDFLIGGIMSHFFYYYHEAIFDKLPSWDLLKDPELIMKFYQHILALVFGVKEINENSKILPNVTLGFHVFANYYDEKMTYLASLELLFGSHDFVPNYKCGTQRNLIAAIGSLDHKSSLHVANIVGLFKIPQLTYGSFASEESDDKELLFYRMVPNEAHHYTGIIQLFRRFRWTWVGLLAVKDHSGERFMQTLELLLSQNGICLAFAEGIPLKTKWQNANDYADILTNMDMDFVDRRVSAVICYGDSRTVLILNIVLFIWFQAIGDTFCKVWILTAQADFGLTRIQRSWDFHLFHGAISFAIHSPELPGFHRFLQDVKTYKKEENNFHKCFWEAAFDCVLVNNKKNSEVVEACSGEEKLEDLPRTVFEMHMSGHSYSIYNAVYAMAHALHAVYSSGSNLRARRRGKREGFQGLQPWQLHSFLQGSSFNNSAGDQVSFNNHREVEKGFAITNLIAFPNESIFRVRVGRLDPTVFEGKELIIHEDLIVWQPCFDQTPPLSECNAHCQPGSEKKKKEGEKFCCYDCSPCPKGKIASQKDTDNCITCPEVQYPSKSQDRCLPKTIIFLSFEEPLGISLASIATFGFLVTTLVLATFIKHKDTPLVKANNWEITCILLVALLFCFLCSFLFLGRPTKVTCFLRQSAFGIVFSVAISCVLAKTITVVIAFTSTHPGSMKRTWKGKQLANVIGLSCPFIQVGICVLWLVTSPPFPDFDTQSMHQEIVAECNEGSVVMFYITLGYMGFLSLLSFSVAFFARNLPDSFNEAKFIAFSMLVFCSVWVSFVPTYLSTKGKYTVAMEIFSVLASSAGLLGCIFSPKCYIILLRPDLNNREQLKRRRK